MRRDGGVWRVNEQADRKYYIYVYNIGWMYRGKGKWWKYLLLDVIISSLCAAFGAHQLFPITFFPLLLLLPPLPPPPPSSPSSYKYLQCNHSGIIKEYPEILCSRQSSGKREAAREWRECKQVNQEKYTERRASESSAHQKPDHYMGFSSCGMQWHGQDHRVI